MITISWQTVITAAAFVSAVIALLKTYNRGYNFVKRQTEQDKIIADIQEEQAILTYGILACLKGLQEQGANGPVTEAIQKIEKHLNEKAHEPKK